MTVRQAALALLAALTLPLASCLSGGDTVTLKGCGATFPAPLYKRWFLEYYRLHPDARTNYLAIGSGAGLNQFRTGLVDFGASDEAQDEKKLRAIARDLGLSATAEDLPLLQIPLTAGSVAVCFNLPGDPELRLTRKALAGILLGDVTSWDDEQIAQANPGVGLPRRPITFVRRAESSGTTFVFTSHVSAISERWKKEYGAGKTVQWPVGLGGKGNAGVAALIQQTPGAIGYIEAGYAELTHLPTAALENRAGQFVKPTAEASQLALTEAKFDEVFRALIPDPRGKDAYPIVTFTWVICRKKYRDTRVADALQDLLRFCLTQGQEHSDQLGYVPLPRKYVPAFLKAVEQIGS